MSTTGMEPAASGDDPPPSAIQSKWAGRLLAGLGLLVVLFYTVSDILVIRHHIAPLTSGVPAKTTESGNGAAATSNIDLGWYPPKKSQLNNLSAVVDGSGVYGFIYNSSTNPIGVPYGRYNWCNMPHVRASEYKRPPKEYVLKYVEVVRLRLALTQQNVRF